MSTSKDGKSYHHGSLADGLVTAGLDLLREGGAEALSLRAAARRAGVSAMAPYRHFADKEALLGAIAAYGFDRLAARLAAADTAPEPAEALIAQGVAYVAFACAEPALFGLMFGTPPAGSLPASPARASAGAASAGAYAVLAARVAGLVDEPRRGEFTLACWSLVHGLATLLIAGRLGPAPTDPGPLAERTTRLLLAALPPRAP